MTVEDLDATIEKIKSLGGTIVGELTEIPEAGKFVVIRDPLGGHTAAIQYVPQADG